MTASSFEVASIFLLPRETSGCLYEHGTIKRTGITCKRILLKKSIEFGIPLK